MDRKSTIRRIGTASVFLGPNLLGFLTFTLGPLVMSLVLAFTNWDLRRHNMFHPDEHLQFVGFGNFVRLLQEANFWRFLGNTLVLLLGLPFSLAGSLGIALLLSRDFGDTGRRATGLLLAGVMGAVAVGAMALVGGGASTMTLLVAGLFGVSILLGVIFGNTVYRTLLYLPSFTSGVATILLWKNLYNPHSGPINRVLSPVLDGVGSATQSLPAWLFQALFAGMIGLSLLLLGWAIGRARRAWADGDLGTGAFATAAGIGLLPVALFCHWSSSATVGWMTLALAGVVVAAGVAPVRRGRAFTCAAGEGLGGAMLIGSILAAGQFALLMIGLLLSYLPAWAAAGLEAPGWHTDYHWAKPAIILIGLWASLGSSNMLLYLAGLTGVPQELYEAADIDGANGRQRFWHITWPQLAPTTFFIVVMSVIGGLQGGFEVARTLTKGGPDGSTTTLSYFIYNEGFVTGRLGYSSAIAWVLILLVFAVTAFNWKFGSRYVND